MIDNKLVYIEWVDSESIRGWEKFEGSIDRLLVCKSVGILVNDGKRDLTISTTVDLNGNFLDMLNIPKVSVRKVKYFKV
jgi:hypothetical protein